MKRIVILASGNGSNAQALIDAASGGAIAGEVVAVISNVPGAHVLRRADLAGIEAFALPPQAGEERTRYDARLAGAVRALSPDVVVLAGWMRILTMSFIGGAGAPVLNIHPALPGEFPGTHAIERAFAERAGGRTSSGVMVHLVPDEGVDEGPVLGTVEVPILADDTIEDFEERMHAAEHGLLVRTVADFLGATQDA